MTKINLVIMGLVFVMIKLFLWEGNSMHFINDVHKQNYYNCIEKFRCINREYSSTCYLAAHPEIFKCFLLEHQVDGPFDWYFEHLEASTVPQASNTERSAKSDIAPLTGQTTALVNLALNLWNGYEFDLAEGLGIWDATLYRVALQAIELRRPIL
jgi:hypothetical protein